MRLALMIEPQQGLSYAEQLAVAQHVEAGGLEALFRSDHYTSFPGPDDNPTTDAWAVLAGLARETSRIGLGALVSPVAFRVPGNIPKVAATGGERSGGGRRRGGAGGWGWGWAGAGRGSRFPGRACRPRRSESARRCSRRRSRS